jgi:K+-sensing histidine kinase KdpD
MGGDDRGSVWIPAGIIGALALGIALIPLRALTSASNLAFVFVAFVIVVAEFGGRPAALATAVVSAMSLNFFLTEPYLTLTMSKTDDAIAFVGMVVCGLIAAAFGTRRERSSQTASRVREDLLALRRVLKPLETGGSLAAALGELRGAFGLGRVVLRDADDRVLAVSPEGTDRSARAAVELNAETLFALDEARYRFGDRGLRLPERGGCLRVPTERGAIALHLWEGDAQGFDQDARQALAVAASVLGVALARRGVSAPSS